jgi:hypothetical protein
MVFTSRNTIFSSHFHSGRISGFFVYWSRLILNSVTYYLLKSVIGMMIWSPQTVQKRQRKCFIYFPRFLPSDLHALVRSHTQPVLHRSPLLFSCLLVKVCSHLLTLFSLDLILGQVHITWLIHVFYTNDMLCLYAVNIPLDREPITWSINEKTGVSAGMEMTRKYRKKCR